MNFNPKLTDFLAEKPNLTIIGLYWAGYWRLVVAIMAVYLASAIVMAILG